MAMYTVDSAKQFLLSQLTQQAHLENVELSDVEKRMFLFSEVGGNPDFEVEKAFEGKKGDMYEAKVARLLSKAYARAKESGPGQTVWEEALQALKEEDFYGLVMVDQAGIRRPQPSVASQSGIAFRSLLTWKVVRFGLSELALFLLAIAFFSDGVSFGLLLPDGVRLLLAAVCLFACWQIGKTWMQF